MYGGKVMIVRLIAVKIKKIPLQKMNYYLEPDNYERKK